ncbi:MAG TPA: DUF3185 family protein [Alphaproteobacteria bacterium]|nr:DUF3185 family protein [Alphaproteobacteria bacterium]
MQPARLVGAVVLVVGVILLGFGINATDAPVDQLSETFTGRYTDRTMWYLVGGGALAAAGILIAILGGRRAS